jgi:hypothetical protein
MWETGGQNDNYGFALAAHPGKSQGRPVTPAGSQPIAQHRPARPAFSQSPRPGTATTLTRLADRNDRTLDRSFIPVHHVPGLDSGGATSPSTAAWTRWALSWLSSSRLVCNAVDVTAAMSMP